MSRLSFLLFSIWFLMLPFSAISSLYFSIGGLAVDKVMAPVLLLIWIGLLLAGKCRLRNNKKFLLIHVFAFFVVRNVSFFDNADLLLELIWRDAILFGYFVLPVLYVDSLKKVDIAARLISFSAVVACVSAFLVAFTIITLPYERFSESRIGFEGVQKSIGLISSYGDVTQLAAFFLLLGLFIPDKLLPTGWKLRRLVKVTVFLIIVMGLIGNQSRSYLLSLITAFGASLFFSYRSEKGHNTILIDLLVVLSAVFILPLMIFMLSEIASMLAGLGGKEAMGTASARLGQYEVAFSLIRENPLFGVGSDFYMQNFGFAHGVHNLWLGQLTRGGIVSALILLILIINIFRRCIRLFKNETAKSYAKVLTGYMMAVFVSTLFYPADTDIFWALLGMCSAIIYTLEFLKTDKLENKATLSNENDILNAEYLDKRILRRAR